MIEINGYRVGFETPYLSVAWNINHEGDDAELRHKLVARWGGARIIVWPGYVFDGASIPRAAWRLVGHPWGDYAPAACIHDILYDSEIWPRKDADKCLRDLIATLPVNRFRRWLIYQAVRLGGGPTWKKHTDQ